MNFPLFYWNIARIPIATTFLFWWCATLVKFGWEVMPQRFLFEWKSASEKFGREVAPPGFHFQSKSTSHAEVTPLHFFFGQISSFRAIEGEEGHATCFAMCFFALWKARAHEQKREQNARNMRVFPAPNYTAPAPFSPSLMDGKAGMTCCAQYPIYPGQHTCHIIINILLHWADMIPKDSHIPWLMHRSQYNIYGIIGLTH